MKLTVHMDASALRPRRKCAPGLSAAGLEIEI